MSGTPFQIVHVDDQPAALTQVKALLEGDDGINELGGVEVNSFESFDAGLVRLDQSPVDIVILDVMKEHGVAEAEPDRPGREAFEQLRAKVFVPVIFYTGFANHVDDLEQDLKLLRVVEKGNADRLIDAVREVIEEGLPDLNRGLFELLREVQRSYMWDFVAHHWPAFREQTDTIALAHLLVRRFALSLSTEGAAGLVAALPGQEQNPPPPESADGKVHPVSMYVMPPVPGATPMAGDVRRGPVDADERYWVVLTPSCDFAQNKADTVLLAGCDLLANQTELSHFLDSDSETRRKKLIKLMCNRGEGRQADRYHFLPGALDLPHLLVDLRDLRTVARDQFDGLQPMASLDAPFAEALLAQFSRYVGRLGTPDPDFDLVVDRLRGPGENSNG